MIDDIESVGTRRPINAANIDQDFKAAAQVIAQELHDRDDLLARNVKRQLIASNRPGLDGSGEVLGGVLAYVLY
jgi:hypothetical protein